MSGGLGMHAGQHQLQEGLLPLQPCLGGRHTAVSGEEGEECGEEMRD